MCVCVCLAFMCGHVFLGNVYNLDSSVRSNIFIFLTFHNFISSPSSVNVLIDKAQVRAGYQYSIH